MESYFVGTKIKTAPPSSVLDAGGAIGHRRRGLRLYAIMLSPFFYSFTSVSNFNRYFSISTIAFVLSTESPRRQPVAVSRNAWMLPYGSGFTGPNFLWGIPQFIVTIIACNCNASSTCFNHSAALPSSQSPPFPRLSRSVLHKPDPPLSPTCVGSGLSRRYADRRTLSVVFSVHRFGKDAILLLLGHHYFVLGFVNPTVQRDYINSPTSFIAHYLWGGLVFLTNFLKITGRFTGFFTETELHRKIYLSYTKSSTFSHLPVGSRGPSSSLTSFLRSGFPPTLWRCLSISITVLLSCGAVRLGPEDAAEFVSTNFRGVEWILTSQFKVTIFLLYDYVVKTLSTQSSTVLISLSSSFEDLSFLFYAVVVYVFNQRGWIIPPSSCNHAS